MRRCGGGASVVGEGARAELLRECGLGAAENDAIRTTRGMRLDALVQQYPDTDIASVLYALWLLGVVDMVRSVLERVTMMGANRSTPTSSTKRRSAIAFARASQLVDEGDYFALLGVPHNATGYEVRRAYLDLRRTFEPSRVLTPAPRRSRRGRAAHHARARRGVRDPRRQRPPRALPPRDRRLSRCLSRFALF